MLKIFILVVSILSNDGELQMKAFPVDKCPDSQSFSQAMDKMKAAQKIKEWNAICIPPQANT